MPEEPVDPKYQALKGQMEAMEENFKKVATLAETLGISIAQMRTHQFTAQPLAENIAAAELLAKCGYPDIEERARAFLTKWKGGGLLHCHGMLRFARPCGGRQTPCIPRRHPYE
jgi:hypothetical protein